MSDGMLTFQTAWHPRSGNLPKLQSISMRSRSIHGLLATVIPPFIPEQFTITAQSLPNPVHSSTRPRTSTFPTQPHIIIITMSDKNSFCGIDYDLVCGNFASLLAHLSYSSTNQKPKPFSDIHSQVLRHGQKWRPQVHCP